MEQYIVGLFQNMSILTIALLSAGVLLCVIEVFVPKVGLSGLLGISLVVTGMSSYYLDGFKVKQMVGLLSIIALVLAIFIFVELLLEAKKQTGLPIVTEIMNINHLDLFENVDIIQVGARNMQNFDLLKELGGTKKPILLKRGLANTLKELLMSAEYIMAGGNENIILCERGIRSFDTFTRNTLDLSAVPMLKEYTHLPVIVDPSHATGISRLVKPMSLAATAAGADGLIIEVHNDPVHALCDGAQSLTPTQFKEVADKVFKLREVIKD